MAQLIFKASNVELSPRSFGPLPDGDYEMMIIKSAMKETKAGNGSYLELEMQIIGGAFSGRRHWEILNLDNPSHKAVQIAQEQLAKLCMALGLDEVKNSEELHDKAFIATLAIDKKDPTRNSIKDYQPTNSSAPAPAAKPAAAAAPVNPQRPWG